MFRSRLAGAVRARLAAPSTEGPSVLTRTAAAPALLALALLTGCGGSDGLSQEEFVSQAEDLCSKANTELEGATAPTTPEEIGPYFQKLLDTADGTTQELEALAADQEDEEELQRIFLTPLRAQVDALQDYLPKVEEAAKAGPDALEGLKEPDLPDADTKAMREYGFEACVTTAES